MFTKRSLTGAVIASTLAVALPLTATAQTDIAKLLRVEGEVLITRDNQSINGLEGRGLNLGDRLTTLDASLALVQFADGCTYVFEENQVFNVGAKSPCALSLQPGAGANGTIGGAASSDGGESGLAWIPPGLAGITAVTAVIDNQRDDSRRDPPPISQ